MPTGKGPPVIRGTPAATAVLLRTGAGNDTVDMGSTNAAFGTINSLRDIRGPLTLDGQSGADDLILRDNGDRNERDYTLSPTTLVRSDSPAAPIDYVNLETLALNGSGGDNVFTPTSTAFTTTVSLHGGDGVNTLDYSALNVDAGSGLVARYSAEGNADDAGGGNHDTLVNGVAFTEGRVGQAFSFDGIDDYVQVPNSPSLESPTITVAAWVNATATCSSPARWSAVAAAGERGVVP